MTDSIIINEKDNVGVMLKGNEIIPAGHKYALCNIKENEFVIKYGAIIGRAKVDIKKGEWVHTHNVKTHLDEEQAYTYIPDFAIISKKRGVFKGYKRKNGRAGIRNEIYILPTVGCVNNVCRRLEKRTQKYVKGSIDGIFSLTHQFGCSQLGDDLENIKKLICAIAMNPNATYVLIVGLGCENNGIAGIQEYLKTFNRNNIRYLNCQDNEDELKEGEKIIKEFADKAKDLKRDEIDLSELLIGLKCGGSDGYSGLTANPLLGKLSDIIISYGGGAVLTEVPEMFGAEQKLMNKCANEDVFERYKKMIIDFKNDYICQGFPVYENPSPGNKRGGITTLEEKSLGCIEKAGTTAINDVLDYGDIAIKHGVSVLNAPGNDLIASTALAACGCQIVLFTTGRGTPFSTFVPTLKIGANNRISEFKKNWMDFNAYSMDLDGLFNLVMESVNGNYKCKSEDVREIGFYKKGVTL